MRLSSAGMLFSQQHDGNLIEAKVSITRRQLNSPKFAKPLQVEVSIASADATRHPFIGVSEYISITKTLPAPAGCFIPCASHRKTASGGTTSRIC